MAVWSTARYVVMASNGHCCRNHEDAIGDRIDGPTDPWPCKAACSSSPFCSHFSWSWSCDRPHHAAHDPPPPRSPATMNARPAPAPRSCAPLLRRPQPPDEHVSPPASLTEL